MKPRTLTGWVRWMGGIFDPSLLGETEEFKSLVNQRTGRPWDDLVDDAIADEWLSLGATSDDLRALLRQDMLAKKFRTERVRRWTDYEKESYLCRFDGRTF